MSEKRLSRRALLRAALGTGASLALAACQPKVVEVTKEIEKIVKETVVVKEEVTKVVEKEKEVTKIVEKVVEKAVPAGNKVVVRYHCRAYTTQAPAP